ncbi:hypothetical protein FisN_21Hu266 [Fistulifera solaris]|uniref:Uncharacterized protein n=1 Tax=Fistulifera solaris TaxID=1519565 RepID=A0A1Z5KNR0_FISSO|nr:hypothetical protein FisN_21Hu266 [Fistulifera solaris]|eukprot:GAX27916.1 hypothetical protein FisN_21Hu266 [Fistulifera solaris]
MFPTRLARARGTSRYLKRWSSSEAAHPLFVWLDDTSDLLGSASKLLLPISKPLSQAGCTHPDDVIELVHQHYQMEHQFVGGMGENDLGVWFASISPQKDTLEFDLLMQESIQAIKEERHGVPFGAFTNGLVTEPPNIPLSEVGLDCIQVSLWAGNPKTYQEKTGLDARAFGQVCGFIANAAEQGIAVEVGISASADVSAARDLAMSLGARDVHVYNTDR